METITCLLNTEPCVYQMQSDVFLCITHANTVTGVFLDNFPTPKYLPPQLLSLKNTTTSWNKFTVTFSELGVLFFQFSIYLFISLFIYLFGLSLCKNEIERCPQLVTVFFCYRQENPVFWGFLANRLLSHNTCVVLLSNFELLLSYLTIDSCTVFFFFLLKVFTVKLWDN